MNAKLQAQESRVDHQKGMFEAEAKSNKRDRPKFIIPQIEKNLFLQVDLNLNQRQARKDKENQKKCSKSICRNMLPKRISLETEEKQNLPSGGSPITSEQPEEYRLSAKSCFQNCLSSSNTQLKGHKVPLDQIQSSRRHKKYEQKSVGLVKTQTTKRVSDQFMMSNQKGKLDLLMSEKINEDRKWKRTSLPKPSLQYSCARMTSNVQSRLKNSKVGFNSDKKLTIVYGKYDSVKRQKHKTTEVNVDTLKKFTNLNCLSQNSRANGFDTLKTCAETNDSKFTNLGNQSAHLHKLSFKQSFRKTEEAVSEFPSHDEIKLRHKIRQLNGLKTTVQNSKKNNALLIDLERQNYQNIQTFFKKYESDIDKIAEVGKMNLKKEAAVSKDGWNTQV